MLGCAQGMHNSDKSSACDPSIKKKKKCRNDLVTSSLPKDVLSSAGGYVLRGDYSWSKVLK